MYGNIIDYLEWYGDFGFDIIPFNEVDNLILSELTYGNYDGIVMGIGDHRKITIKEVSEYVGKEDYLNGCSKLEKLAANIICVMAGGKRFADATLYNYMRKHDFDNHEQFEAMHIRLGDGSIFVSFGGTDDTLLGWKEDFDMAYKLPGPGQTEAVNYLNNTISRYGISKVRVGGHSKGGNLAIYSSVMCKTYIKKRIERVYSNDGPGFLKPMIESDDYKEMLDKIVTIVPETSIIGMLLEHKEKYKIVASSKRGIEQHDAMNWHVYKDGFVELDARDKNSVMIDNAVSSWLDKLSDEERRQFVQTIYDVFTRAGINYLSEFDSITIPKVRAIFREMKNLDSETKKAMRNIVALLASQSGKAMKDFIHSMTSKEEKNND